MEERSMRKVLWSPVMLAVCLIIEGGCMFGEKIDVVRDFTPESITGIAVTVASANVRILPAEANGKVRFHYYGWSLAKPDLVSDLVDGVATFTDTSKSQRLGDLKLDVYVPGSFEKAIAIQTSSGCATVDDLGCAAFSFTATSGNLTVKSLRASGALSLVTTTGNCTAGTFEAGKYAFSSKSGNLTADSLLSDEVSFVSTSGNRKVKRLVAEKLDSTATSGGLTIDDCSASDFRAESTNGSITVAFSAFDRTRVVARTTTGSITVTVPRFAGFSFAARTETGSISSDIPQLEEKVSGLKQVTAQVASGAGSLDLTSHTGSLKISGV
jgi:DUF4097 and DUF4098 domain-containing protein YvlB